MADIRRLTTTRGAHRGQMTKLMKKLEDTKKTMDEVPSEIQTFRAVLDSVHTKFDYLKKLDDAIIEATETDKLLETISESDDYINELNIQITTLSAVLTIGNTNDSRPSQDSSKHKVNLPKLQLPKFDGNFLNWTGFNDAFTAAVDNDPNLDAIQKFQYLSAQLTGDAAKAIEGLQLTSDNYPEALELLRKRYGQKHKLISCYMKALWELRKPDNSMDSIREFYDNLESYIRGLKSLGKTEDSFGDLLVPIVFEKLPGHIRTHISREHGDNAWTISELKDSLYKEIQAAQAGENNYLESIPEISSTSAFHVATTHKKACAFCKGSHSHTDCVIVTDRQKRRDIVKRARLCFNCLRGNHTSSQCMARGRCFKCKQKHHTSLCDASINTLTRPTEAKGLVNPHPNTHVTFTPTSSPVLLKTAVATLESLHRRTDANILLDEGAMRTFITAATATRLGIDMDNCETENVKLATFGTDIRGIQAVKVSTVKLITSDGRVDIRALIVPKISAPMNNFVKSTVAAYPYLRSLTLARSVTADDFEIDLLIGADYYWTLVGNDVIRGPGPTAVSSKLGFLLSGPTNLQTNVSVGLCQTICLKVACDIMDSHQDIDKLSRYWDLEMIGVTEDDTIPHTKNFEKFRDENIHMVDNRYSVKLPWRKDHPPLPTNYNLCCARTRSMVRNLPAELLDTYNTIITEQLERRFIERVSNDDITRGHYIPHHCVKKDSATTPIRVVYDCSCKKSDNPSLNQCLETGPPLLNDMVGILLRFRTNDVAFTADIEKAFLNVGLEPEDREYTKFLWLSDPQDPESMFTVYRFKVVLFGATCSPFILNAVVKTHLESNLGDTSRDLAMNTYMDDVISGVQSEFTSPESASQRAINYYAVANDIMQRGGFKLRMWATNDPKLRQIAQNDGNNDPADNVNVVGIKWLTNSDMLTYSDSVIPNVSILPTKREVVRITSSLFDPLGLLAPVHVQAKLFIQELWKGNNQWDELLSEDLTSKWNSIRQELESSKDIMLKRPYFTGDSNHDYELHIFADASTRAYGSVIYLKRGNETAIVMAKTRLKPPKDMTLPRLELMAALIGARLAKFVTKELSSINIVKRVLWCDSQIVIHWLLSDKKLPIFVDNRVKEIRGTNFDDIKYCNTKHNPADLLTRGISAKDLAKSELWWKGPSWLPTGDWPICDLFDSTALSCDAATCDAHTLCVNDLSSANDTALLTTTATDSAGNLQNVIDITRYSTLGKLLRVTAYVYRFINNLKKRTHVPCDKHITVLELRDAKRSWINAVQLDVFTCELKAIQCNQKCALVHQLKLFTDSDGLIRCAGRFQNADLQYNQKFPILLPTRHAYTLLEITHAHAIVLHSGVGATITHIRQTLWIPKARQVVKSVLKRCRQCLAVNGQPYAKPITPPLPACRIRETPPFLVTGVDFTGVLYYKDAYINRNKAYVCLYTCAVTRGIHLELVSDMSTEAFLRSFRRFASRRSLPSHMISDNGTTFISANETLKDILTSTHALTYLASRGVIWKFIPKRAPWFGGFYERLIGVTKTTLRKVLGRACVTFDELNTLLIEIEAVINDRPLTVVASDIEDMTPLTPSHLLNGRMLTTLPHRLVDDDELSDPDFALQSQTDLQKRSVYLDKLFRHLWTRWRNEYLPALREHQTSNAKRGCNDNSIRVGDVVLVHSDTDKRTNWRLAKVQKLNYGLDGLVRSADIRTQNGVTNRPIIKLYPLEVNSDNGAIDNSDPNPDRDIPESVDKRPVRKAAERARNAIKHYLY